MSESNPKNKKKKKKGKLKAATKTVNDSKVVIEPGDKLPKNGPGLNKLATIPKTYQLTPRAVNLLTLAANADKAQGKRATLTGKVENAIIEAYAHLEIES